METKKLRYDPLTETQMGAFVVPLQVGREFRAMVALHGASQRDLFIKFMLDYTKNPKKWLEEERPRRK